MKNSIIGIAALVLPLALVAPSALAHDDFCYMEMDGQTVNLDHMCGSPDRVPTQRQTSTTQPIEVLPQNELLSGRFIIRSTADANRSTANSFLRISDVSVSANGYVSGTIVNQGQLPAEFINLRFGPSGSDYPVYIPQSTLEPQQRTDFRVYAGYIPGFASGDVVASWSEWVQE